MSSRTENDDPWLRLPLRTAGCGPRAVLPAVRGNWCASMTSPLKPDRGRKPGQDGQLPPLTGPPRERDGWLVGHWTGITILFPLGMILGIGLSIALIIFRVTRS